MLLLPILAAVLLLFGTSLLIGTLGYRGRRGRRGRHGLAAASVRALAGADAAVVPLFIASVELRRDLEAALATGQAIVGVDRYVDTDSRGPLWRRLNDAGFRQALAAARPALRRWLGLVDPLPPSERSLVESAAPIIAALLPIVDGDHGEPVVQTALAGLERAREALVRIEAALASHHPNAYR